MKFKEYRDANYMENLHWCLLQVKRNFQPYDSAF